MSHFITVTVLDLLGIYDPIIPPFFLFFGMPICFSFTTNMNKKSPTFKNFGDRPFHQSAPQIIWQPNSYRFCKRGAAPSSFWVYGC